MGESAVMLETEHRAMELADHVKVGRLGGERKGGGRQQCLTIQPRTPHASAGQKVSDGFQSVTDIVMQLWDGRRNALVGRGAVIALVATGVLARPAERSPAWLF